jgi:hypothetical protein
MEPGKTRAGNWSVPAMPPAFSDVFLSCAEMCELSELSELSPRDAVEALWVKSVCVMSGASHRTAHDWQPGEHVGG